MTTSTKVPNRLINEKSPYLLQHAYNPVDWYPWCDEAFERAKAEDKPVFLSIGYSTCHWCHVMERESFEDEEVAALLRGNYIAVKVDKEERPDIDAVYMDVTQALTGSGGWPMTLLLTPDKKPFFAGTYFPKSSRYGMSGLLDILGEASVKWNTDKRRLESFSDELVRRIADNAAFGSAEPTRKIPEEALHYFSAAFDAENGGFGRAPKFPSPHNLMFLMRYAVFGKEPHALVMAEKTLDQMYRGGLFDHIGGGFSRYSTDNRWLVPHFEKMLYDNALLTIAYLEAYQLGGREVYKRVAERTLEYIAREMTSPDGGFYCAQDADSEGQEGLYYVWRFGEILDLLGAKDGGYWNRCFAITKQGNFEGQNIPNLLANENFAEENGRIAALSEKLLEHRTQRMLLHKDDKSLTSWNSLMVTAYAKAYAILGGAEYLEAAERGIGFIRAKLTDEDSGRLMVSFCGGQAKGFAYLDDYAFYTWALLSLYEATFETAHLESALGYADKMCGLFEDTENGGFFMYSEDSEPLVTRPKETYDGAMPSGNSAAAYVLCKLAALTGDMIWDERARRQLSFMASVCDGNSAAYCFSNIAMMSAVYPSRQLICAASLLGDVSKLRGTLAKHFLPDLTVLVITPENRERLTAIIPSLCEYSPQNGETAFYMCENNTCGLPFTGFDALEERL